MRRGFDAGCDGKVRREEKEGAVEGGDPRRGEGEEERAQDDRPNTHWIWEE